MGKFFCPFNVPEVFVHGILFFQNVWFFRVLNTSQMSHGPVPKMLFCFQIGTLPSSWRYFMGTLTNVFSFFLKN